MSIAGTLKKAVIGAAIIGAVGGGAYYLGKKSIPDEVKYHARDEYVWRLDFLDKTETEHKTQTETSKQTNVAVHSKTTKKITETPDGGKVTEEVVEVTTGSTTTEEEKNNTDLAVHNDVAVATNEEARTETDLAAKKGKDKKWAAALGAEVNLNDVRHLSLSPGYYLSLSRTLIGPVNVGATVTSQKSVGAFVEIQFDLF